MKRKHTLFSRAMNTATEAINAASGMFQELTLPEGQTTIRFKLSDYGEFPVTDVRGKDIIQVVDKAAGETMALNFGSLRGKFATFFRGIPIFEGHADDAEWLKKNPGHRASAAARIKTIEPEDDAIWATAAVNSAGIDLLGGEAPKYTGHSPNWRLSQIPGRPGCYRPILLWSVALTNTPNILTNTIALNALQGMAEDSPDAGCSGETENQENNDMKLTPDALKALGFAPDALPTTEEISAAIVKMLSDKAAAEADKATAVGETTAVNSRLSLMQTELNLVRGAAVETVISDAIQTGRITEAERPAWTTALNTSFATESAKLKTLMPVLNTRNQVAGKVDKDRGHLSGTTDALNEAVREIAKDNGLDLTKTTDYDRAWKMLRTAKPELFAK